MKGDAPDWFSRAIIDAIATMYTARLSGFPANDSVKQTAQVWIVALWGNYTWAESDTVRIKQTSIIIAGTRQKWVTPKEFYDHIPPIAIERRLTKQTKEETPDELAEQARRGREAMERIQQLLADAMKKKAGKKWKNGAFSDK